MATCTECREKIRSGASICPYCQSKVYPPDFSFILWIAGFWALVFFGLCLIGSRGNVLEAIKSFWTIIKFIFDLCSLPIKFIIYIFS